MQARTSQAEYTRSGRDAGERDGRSESVADRLRAAQARLAEMEAACQEVAAESGALQRRADLEVARAEKFAIEGFAEALMPVKDSLEAAMRTQTGSLAALREGLEMTLRLLSCAFESHALREINPASGDRFDPALHHAVSMMPSRQEPGTVIHVLQKGYMIGDRLLRPALVNIAR